MSRIGVRNVKNGELLFNLRLNIKAVKIRDFTNSRRDLKINQINNKLTRFKNFLSIFFLIF